MSKLINIYTNLKKEDPNTLYMFKSGIFYIFLDKDATIMNQLFNLKLTNFNDKVLKCGFPCASLDKYQNLLRLTSYKTKIIDIPNNVSYTLNQYVANNDMTELIEMISKTDEDTLSVKEAYDFINKIKKLSKQILSSLDN